MRLRVSALHCLVRLDEERILSVWDLIKLLSSLFDPLLFITSPHPLWWWRCVPSFLSAGTYVCVWCACVHIFCVQSVSQQGCVISAGHTTHSWDARALWRGHSCLSHTPAVNALIKINPQLHITLSKLYNCVRKELGIRLGNHHELTDQMINVALVDQDQAPTFPPVRLQLLYSPGNI